MAFARPLLAAAWLLSSSVAGYGCDAPSSRPASPAAAPAKPELVTAPAELASVQSYIAAEVARSEQDHRTLLVYVGAAWCEPCRRFHDALTAGKLDSALPSVRFVEFDYDKQREALNHAGYTSTLLPLFSIPNADGAPSQRRIEGSIKGETAVSGNLLPRLHTLLEPALPAGPAR